MKEATMIWNEYYDCLSESIEMSERAVKLAAKRLHEATACGRARAHEIVARHYGYKTYNEMLKDLREQQ